MRLATCAPPRRFLQGRAPQLSGGTATRRGIVTWTGTSIHLLSHACGSRDIALSGFGDEFLLGYSRLVRMITERVVDCNLRDAYAANGAYAPWTVAAVSSR